MSRRPAALGKTWRELWRATSEQLADPVQSRWLLEEVSGADGASMLRRLDDKAPPAAGIRLDSLVQRCVAGEPLQRVLGHWSFRSLEVDVDSRVLVPRPETEVVVGLALAELDKLCRLRSDQAAVAVDLGTGSGVIALSIACERSRARVVATDRDLGALEVAASNLSCVGPETATRVQLCAGDWYEALPGELSGQVDLIVSNPPYVAEREWPELEPTVRDFDPFQALVAGPSGLEAIEKVVSGAPDWLKSHGALVVEIAPHQAIHAVELSLEAGFDEAVVKDDLAGRSRALVARR